MPEDVRPPLDPILIPDSPGDGTKPKPAVVPLAESNPVPPRVPREPEPPRFTLAEALDYFVGPNEDAIETEFQNERAVRAVAFLLHYCSEGGNNEVHGFLASGLGHTLETCAENIARVSAYRRFHRGKGGE